MEEIKCKVCPIECVISVNKSKDKDKYILEGYSCNRGFDYAINQLTKPAKVITGRVILKNGNMSRLPVKTSGPVSKDRVDACLELIRNTSVTAPVIKGQIIIKNILNLGVDVVAQRRA